MRVKELSENSIFQIINEGNKMEEVISQPFCCDLLSLVMGRAPEAAAWVTVMSNVNTLAVAVLADVACVIMAEGVAIDDITLQKAKEQGVTVLGCDASVFEAALEVYRGLNA